MTTIKHEYQDIIDLFFSCYAKLYQTKLVKGDSEPLYLPAEGKEKYHQVIFANGYYASALHEIAHWCIAGEQRRKLVDYGYWYCPDGRTKDQQTSFENAEIKPQALEWLFCVAAQFPFNVSCDNLAGDFQPDRIAFQRKVYDQVCVYLKETIPHRAVIFIEALRSFYKTPKLTESIFIYPEYIN